MSANILNITSESDRELRRLASVGGKKTLNEEDKDHPEKKNGSREESTGTSTRSADLRFPMIYAVAIPRNFFRS
jgi:hypothetical protein